ncbi:hypothetical protein GCM10007938_23470 [Vibrio zhanjiangensis]|uniref:Uncharacterized protein n=1 Tax=Vibrio zhanjiangensis TaxID=1046128 RepID=A0ABQ6EZC8_9VIBR|nr:hypothetical protein [Vibrio zhanjiangensis]GLT18568.1 hypothetical protein GCM10007938_23470 [Vibrio zhanjiangensis]
MTKFIAIAFLATVGVYELFAGDFITGLPMIAFAVVFAVVETSEGKPSDSVMHNDSSGGDSGGGD